MKIKFELTGEEAGELGLPKIAAVILIAENSLEQLSKEERNAIVTRYIITHRCDA